MALPTPRGSIARAHRPVGSRPGVARGHPLHRSGLSVRVLRRAGAAAPGVALRRPAELADADDRPHAGAGRGREARRGRADAPAAERHADRPRPIPAAGLLGARLSRRRRRAPERPGGRGTAAAPPAGAHDARRPARRSVAAGGGRARRRPRPRRAAGVVRERRRRGRPAGGHRPARSPSPAARALDHKLGGPPEQRRYTAPSYEIRCEAGAERPRCPAFTRSRPTRRRSPTSRPSCGAGRSPSPWPRCSPGPTIRWPRPRSPRSPSSPHAGPRRARPRGAAGGGRCRLLLVLEEQKPPGERRLLHSGGGIRTRDLRVMSPTSYQTAPPRGAELHDSNTPRNDQPARRGRERRESGPWHTSSSPANCPATRSSASPPSTTSTSGRATCRPARRAARAASPTPRGCCRCSPTGSTPSCSTPRRSCARSPTTRSASTTSTSRPATARGIPVGNTPDVLTDATADLAWALMLAVARRIAEAAPGRARRQMAHVGAAGLGRRRRPRRHARRGRRGAHRPGGGPARRGLRDGGAAWSTSATTCTAAARARGLRLGARPADARDRATSSTPTRWRA